MTLRFNSPIMRGALAAATALGLLAGPSIAQEEKVKIYLSLSYTGNSWMSEAANVIKALAKTPPYDTQVELIEVISGVDVQAQISAYESMIADGAKGIISFPISSTGLNRAIKQGCDAGVEMFMFANHVTEPCAYSLAYIGSGFGENTAQWLANEMEGKGKIFMIRGVPGSAVDVRHYDGAMSVFGKYPEIEVVAEYYGMWDDQTTQTETTKALAAHPDVQGIWSQAGEHGALQALLATGRQDLIPIAGENSAGFRRALIDPALQERGLTGISSGDTPAVAAIAFKMMMEKILAQREIPNHNMAYTLPWVTADKIVLCTGDIIENGCNTFPADKVPASFISEAFDPVYAPEISLASALTGEPTPGATIQPLPAGEMFPEAQALPGINCDDCELPADAFALKFVKPFDAK